MSEETRVTGALRMTEAPGDIRALFGLLERASTDVDVLETVFADQFLNCDPNGAAPVTREALVTALPMRERLFASAGLGSARLMRLRTDELDARYILARTEWAVPDESGAEGVRLDATYLVRRTEAGPRIVVYLNHLDIAQVLAAHRAEASAPAFEPAPTPAPAPAAVVSLTFDSYLRASADSVWQALTAPDLVPRWRFGMTFETDWHPGGSLRTSSPDGTGRVTESDPGRVLAYEWTAADPAVNGGRASGVRFELGRVGETTRLTARHTGLQEGAPFLRTVTGGWPMMLASLKSLLETGVELRFG